MQIHLYTICWNESQMLPYFLRHYENIADKIVIYDNRSDDDTASLAQQHPRCDVRTIGADELDERHLLFVKSEAWKESRGVADWVIACDVDEFLHHDDVRGYLGTCLASGVTLPRVAGYEIVARDFPANKGQIYDTVKRGFPRDLYSKRIVFSPTKIEEINYSPGCHTAAPIGNVIEDQRGELRMLHAGSVGFQRIIQRRRAMWQRSSSFNRDAGFGKHYDATAQEIEQQLNHYHDIAQHLWFLGYRGASLVDYARLLKGQFLNREWLPRSLRRGGDTG